MSHSMSLSGPLPSPARRGAAVPPAPSGSAPDPVFRALVGHHQESAEGQPVGHRLKTTPPATDDKKKHADGAGTGDRSFVNAVTAIAGAVAQPARTSSPLDGADGTTAATGAAPAATTSATQLVGPVTRAAATQAGTAQPGSDSAAAGPADTAPQRAASGPAAEPAKTADPSGPHGSDPRMTEPTGTTVTLAGAPAGTRHASRATTGETTPGVGLGSNAHVLTPGAGSAQPSPPGIGTVTQATGQAAGRPSPPAALPAVPAQLQPAIARLVSRGDGTHRMSLQLHPAELGEVRITMTVRDGSVDVALAASPASQDVFRDGSAQLRSLLSGSGHTLGQLVVRDLPGPGAVPANGAAPAGPQLAAQLGQQGSGQPQQPPTPSSPAAPQGQFAGSPQGFLQQQTSGQAHQQPPRSRSARQDGPAGPLRGPVDATAARAGPSPRGRPSGRAGSGIDVRI